MIRGLALALPKVTSKRNTSMKEELRKKRKNTTQGRRLSELMLHVKEC